MEKTGKNVKTNHTLKLTITKKLISIGGIKEVFFTKTILTYGKKGKVFPYSLPSVGSGADPGVQAVSPQVT